MSKLSTKDRKLIEEIAAKWPGRTLHFREEADGAYRWFRVWPVGFYSSPRAWASVGTTLFHYGFGASHQRLFEKDKARYDGRRAHIEAILAELNKGRSSTPPFKDDPVPTAP